jgi:hypothetical protein
MTTTKTTTKKVTITAAQIRELASQPDATRAIISQCFLALNGDKRARRVCVALYSIANN